MSALLCFLVFFFFFKQKTAYEMRISDWSSDVCSSDLHDRQRVVDLGERAEVVVERRHASPHVRGDASHRQRLVTVPVHQCERGFEDRKSVVSGKSVSVRVDLGGRRIIKKKKTNKKKIAGKLRTPQTKIQVKTQT